MKQFFVILLIGVISLGAIWPLLGGGYFPMHDDTQVARVVVMGRALREGQFPVRWVSDLGYGYGYPIFNFYGPLPYYIGGALATIGVPALIATKIMFLAGIILLSASTFALANAAWGMAAGVLAATLALYAPYHAVQIYVRGAVGEFWASAFIPLVLLGFRDITKVATRKRGIIVGAVGLSLTIMSHTITAYMAVIIIAAGALLYAITCLWHKHVDIRVVRSGFMLLILGLGLSAFFWLPALFEMQYTSVAGQIGRSADFHTHFVCFSQLWESPWGFGGSVPGCLDGLSFKLGKFHVLLAGIGFVLFLKRKKGYKEPLFYIAMFLLMWSLAFATSISEWFWEHIPGFAYIQYPWRYLSGSTLALALIAAVIGAETKWFIRWVGIPILVFSIITIHAKWFRPQYLYPKDSHVFEAMTELRFRASKVSDEYLPPLVIRPDNPQGIVRDTISTSQELSVLREVDTAVYARYAVMAQRPRVVLINRAYFPGWRYYIDGEPVKPLLSHGLPSILVPNGKSVIELRFTDTPVRTIANLISMVAIIWLFIFYGKTKKTNT